MVIALIAKRRQSEDGQRKWVNYSCKRGRQWYDVKFVHDCAPPKVYDIDKPNNVLRSFIDTDENGSNVTVRGGRQILYVESYKELSVDELKTAVDAELAIVKKFREARKANTRNFFAGDTPPTGVDMPSGTENPQDGDLPF